MLNDFQGKLVADKYRIHSLIREGSSGDLYSAHNEILDKPVTVEILPSALAIDQRWVKRFISDARSASAISHPNVLSPTDFGTDAKGISYAVFENASGETLSQRLSEAPFSEKRSLDILRQIAAGVSAAHEKKVIHGELNPESVLVSSENDVDTVKVTGFGAENKVVAARAVGPQYLAPEQITGFPVTDERSDVYALGVMFYEMLTGEVPFDGDTAAEVAAKQNSEPPPPMSAFRDDLHPEVEPIILSAIAIDPERRYQTVSAFAEDLDILSGRLGLPVEPAATVAAAAATGPKRNVWQTAFIGLAGISLLAAALIYFTSVRQTDATAQLQPEAGYLPVQPIGPATGAQEESLAKLPTMTEAEIMATSAAMMEQPPGTLPGGDGYNAWANGGAPPVGAPLQQYVPPGGQVYQIDPNNPSQFMPADGSGVILVPVPMTNTNTAAKPEPSPKTPAANSAAPAGPEAKTTPKPLATPPPKGEKPADKPAKGKAPEKPIKNDENETSESGA